MSASGEDAAPEPPVEGAGVGGNDSDTDESAADDAPEAREPAPGATDGDQGPQATAEPSEAATEPAEADATATEEPASTDTPEPAEAEAAEEPVDGAPVDDAPADAVDAAPAAPVDAPAVADAVPAASAEATDEAATDAPADAKPAEPADDVPVDADDSVVADAKPEAPAPKNPLPTRNAAPAEPADEAPADAKPEAPAPKNPPPTRNAAPADSGSADAKHSSAPDKPPVDQATAVFKAPRVPAVDNPTTALKMPPAPRPETDPAKPVEPAAPAASGQPASTFVPLRSADAGGTSTADRAEAAASALAPAALTEAERTRQQPMPPLPPLDLLAELTNTPPPRQTAVRSVARRVKIWTPLVLLLLIVFAVVQTLRPLPEPELTLAGDPTYTFKGGKLALPFPGEGQGAVEVEGVGTVGTYGAQKPAPIASVAKTMTAYVILKEHPITGEEVGEKIKVDQQAEDEGKNEDESTAKITLGQQFTERQMLQLLMIPSGNNAARLLARWDATTEAEFVKKMNDAAKDLGMTNSTYTDPSGLKATTVSTPLDQLKLAKAVMQNDIFREIVNTPMTTIPGIDGSIRNNNDAALLKDGVGGIKTGSSTPAGGNLLWSANTLVDGKVRRIVGITMGVQNARLLNDKLDLAIAHSIKVIEAAQAGVTSATVVKKGEVVGYVEDGLGGRTAVVATKDLKAVGWGGLQVKIEINDAGKGLPHSAKAGEPVGQVSVGTGTGKVTAPVALQGDLAEPGFGDKLTRIG